MNDSSATYYKGKKKIVRLHDGLEAIGLPMPGNEGPRWKNSEARPKCVEWAERHGSDDRQQTYLAVGGAQYIHWVKITQAYVKPQPPGPSG